jgi:DNA-binding GntR family transcriptional regulator
MVSKDHTKILDAIECQDTATATRLTREISVRVELECIETLRHIKVVKF